MSDMSRNQGDYVLPKPIELRKYVCSKRCSSRACMWASAGHEFQAKCIFCGEAPLEDAEDL